MLLDFPPLARIAALETVFDCTESELAEITGCELPDLLHSPARSDSDSFLKGKKVFGKGLYRSTIPEAEMRGDPAYWLGIAYAEWTKVGDWL